MQKWCCGYGLVFLQGGVFFRGMPLDTFMAETMSCLGSGIQDGGCMGGGSGRGRMGHGLMVVMAE